MEKKIVGICILLLAMILGGCGDNPRLCPEGIYGEFRPDPIQGFDIESSKVNIWMVHCLDESCCCLPQNLSVHNLTAPANWRVSIMPPGWIKGRPLMSVHIDWGTYQPTEEVVSFDIYQGLIKKQTIVISIAKKPEISIMVGGIQLETVQY